MENFINIGTFIQQLTHYLKIGIYTNKGTDQNKILERCIKLHNMYKAIEIGEATEDADANEVLIRKCLKRLNLVLKIDDQGRSIDIRKKESQLNIIQFKEHAAISNDDLSCMLEFATNNKINIFTEIPLIFILREGKHQKLLWQYTRSLFYISQAIIANVDPEADQQNPIILRKKQVYDEAISKLEVILENISAIEEQNQLNNLLKADKFLKHKLMESGITDKKVNIAKNEVKKLFANKGFDDNSPLPKMVDSICEKILDMPEDGNIIQNIFGIGQSIAMNMKNDPTLDLNQMRDTMGALTDVLKDTMDDPEHKDALPAGLKDTINSFMKMMPGENDENNETDNEKLMACFDELIKTNNLDREEFYNSIKNDQGVFDVAKLENYINEQK